MDHKRKTKLERDVARDMRHGTIGHITYALKIICLEMIMDFPVDIQIGISAVWV